MTILVTAQDIERGRREECRSCPVAIAINRAIPSRNWRSLVGLYEVAFEFGAAGTYGLYPVANLPRAASTFIARFDREEPVEPFEFVMALPEAVL